MVFGCEDDALHACLLADMCPLAAVKVRRVEQFQVLVAKAPFLVGIGVHGVVDECVHLHVLPTKLILVGYWSTRRRSLGIYLCSNNQGGDEKSPPPTPPRGRVAKSNEITCFHISHCFLQRYNFFREKKGNDVS
jgi:hypothetical protein